MFRALAAFPVVALAIVAAATSPASAGVMMGEFAGARESRDVIGWGDGVHNLRQEWSARTLNGGYVYGTNFSGSNADVYNAGRVDPMTIADASGFPYQKQSTPFTEGDTILFRGSNGYYGAWVTHDIYPTGNTVAPLSLLDATWFFQSDQTASFVPEPAALSLLAMPAIMLRRRRRPRPLSC
jgi:hypothetical protein